MNYHYRDKAGQEIGPITLDALAKLRFANVLNGDTPVRLSNGADWKPCRDVIADPVVPAAAAASTVVTPVAKSTLRQYGWSFFAFAFACFLLPFLNLSCAGTKVVTVSGFELITGKEVAQRNAWTGEIEKKQLRPQEFGPDIQKLDIATLACAGAALLLALMRQRKTSLLSALAGAGGAIALFMLKSKIETQFAIRSQGQGPLHLEFKEGFWLATAFLISGAIGQLKLFNDPQEQASAVSTKGLRLQRRQVVGLGVLLIGAGLIYGGWMLHQHFSARTTLSFDLSFDGKPLPSDVKPQVTVDGQPFSSGSRIKMGRHQLVIQLKDGEPFERKSWVFYGEKNLGTLPLESSKGSLALAVTPSPATIVLKRQNEIIRQGDAPLKVDKLPVGDYTVIVRRGEYEENHAVKIQRQQLTDSKIELDLGSVNFFADPADAEFELSGNGRHWQGKLPTRIDDVPAGTYSVQARRKGWEINSDVVVSRGGITTNKTEFQYGSINVTSDPTGLVISTNGMEIGKTPFVLGELKPEQYSVTVTDGENDLSADITVGPKEAAKHDFVFRYGAVQLATTPAGATVLRKGKEAGKTPLKLEHIPAGDISVMIKLDGYVTTNFALHVVEHETANITAKLISERYLQAMKQAQEAFEAGQFTEAQQGLAIAESIEPGSQESKALGNLVSFNIHYQNAARLAKTNQFREALTELAEADKLFPDSEHAKKLRQSIEEGRVERLNFLVQKASDSLSQGLIEETVQLLEEANKLEPRNSRVAELQRKANAAVRDKVWNQFTQRFQASTTSKAHLWVFQTDLAGAQSGIEKALKEVLGPWKIKSQEKPCDGTITLTLEPRGILGQISFPHPCALMVSEVRSGAVEIRSHLWVYPPESQYTDSARDFLNSLDLTLFNSLKRQLGQPMALR